MPAAALTAFARSEDRTKALRSGFEMHLAKPVDPGELVASVATLFRRAQHRELIGSRRHSTAGTPLLIFIDAAGPSLALAPDAPRARP